MQVNNINGNHFFRFPIKMVFEGTFAQMSHPAKDVFVVLGAHANWKTGECFVSLNTIAERTGYCRRSVIYAVHELENLKAVFVIRRQGYCNHYIIAHYRTDNPNPTDDNDDDGNDGGQAELNLTEEIPSGDGASDQQVATAEDEGNEPEDQEDGPETEQEPETEADVEPEETIEENTSQQQLDEESAQPEPPQEEQAVSETDEQNVQQEEHQEQGEDEGRQQPHETQDEKSQEDESQPQEETKQQETAAEAEYLNKHGVQADAPTSETQCTTQCNEMHQPVQTDAPKQNNRKPDRISDNKSTAPPSEEWYRALSTESQSSVLCCTRGISDVFAATFGGKFVPAPVIMEKLMEGYEPQFLMDIIRHANVPMILNPIGWFRSISATWHVKGENEEEYWRRLACHGINAMPILVSDEIIEQNPELAEDMEGMVERAMQVYQLAVRYNNTIGDLKMLSELATEGDNNGKDTSKLWKNHDEVGKQLERVLAGIQAFDYQCTDEERENGFDMEALKAELKTWEQ